MLTDAHCHPFDLSRVFPQTKDVSFEEDRRRLGVIAAASACDLEEFKFNEKLAQQAKTEGSAPLLPCFAIHPQMLSHHSLSAAHCSLLIAHCEKLAIQGRLAAVGECGFDLYSAIYRETEAQQDTVFAAHLEIALRYNLPVVLHVRRAMHKIFAYTKTLKKCKAVVFHSWPGTFEEGLSLLRRGVNVYFSFGNTILNGHKQQVQCCSGFPADRILTETDAPYQPVRGMSFSCWADLPRIVKTAAALRNITAKEFESQIEINFRKAFI